MVTAVRVARPSLIDQGLDRPGVADIDHRGRSGTGSVPGQFTSGAFGAVTVDVGHHHRVAPGDQRAGQGAPDARGGPGNDCYPRHRDLRSPRSRHAAAAGNSSSSRWQHDAVRQHRIAGPGPPQTATRAGRAVVLHHGADWRRT